MKKELNVVKTECFNERTLRLYKRNFRFKKAIRVNLQKKNEKYPRGLGNISRKVNSRKLLYIYIYRYLQLRVHMEKDLEFPKYSKKIKKFKILKSSRHISFLKSFCLWTIIKGITPLLIKI